MLEKYILDDVGQPVLCPDLKEWAEWFHEPERRRVESTDLEELGKVSTVFLGIDHGFSFYKENPLFYKPTLWETMVFGGPMDEYQARYTSLDDAKRDHQNIVRMLKSEGSR